jgi:hypothetical protein
MGAGDATVNDRSLGILAIASAPHPFTVASEQPRCAAAHENSDSIIRRTSSTATGSDAAQMGKGLANVVRHEDPPPLADLREQLPPVTNANDFA